MFILASGFLKQLKHFYFDVLVALTSEKREKTKLKKINKSSAVMNLHHTINDDGFYTQKVNE